MRDEYDIHMEHFNDCTHDKGKYRGRFLFIEDIHMQHGGKKTSQTGRNAAGNPGITAYIEICSGNIPFNPADQAGQNAGQRIEKQTGGQRTDIPHIEHHIPEIHTKVC